MDVDIHLITNIGYPVIVEFDGAYWHKDRIAQDTEKTQILLDSGFSVVRVREGDLPFIGITHPDLHQLNFKWNLRSKGQDVSEIASFVAKTFTTNLLSSSQTL